MSKVLVDRELLDQLQEKLDPHRDAVLWGEVCDAIRRAQPAEAEGLKVAGFLYKNNGQALTAADMDADTFALMARSDFDGEVEKLVRQTDHIAALSAVTAERDRLREALDECVNSLHAEMLQKFGGQKPEDMHPVTRRDYDRDMEEIAEYRAAMAAKEA